MTDSKTIERCLEMKKLLMTILVMFGMFGTVIAEPYINCIVPEGNTYLWIGTNTGLI